MKVSVMEALNWKEIYEHVNLLERFQITMCHLVRLIIPVLVQGERITSQLLWQESGSLKMADRLERWDTLLNETSTDVHILTHQYGEALENQL